MLSIAGADPDPGQRRVTRRELLRVGRLSALGLSVPWLLQNRSDGGSNGPATKNRGNSCVFIFLFGGPSHIDLWDMKPAAPLEIRGAFKPIATRVPGIQVCEHLPLMAARADKFCLIRSMTHHMPVHGPACSELYSGRPYFGPPTTDQAKPEDWPSVASMVMRYGPECGGWPPSIVLPWYTQFAGQDKPIAGQTGGRMGPSFRPFLVGGDPSRPGFGVAGLRLPENVTARRAELRHSLLRELDGLAARKVQREFRHNTISEHHEAAFALLKNARAVDAFELAREPRSVRERYGDSKFAQSLLLSRRLVEAGIPLVTVNWDDETRDDKVSPFWDTHSDNFPSLENRLAPRFDRAYSALLDDLDGRGLLESTLVVVTGEFGRTPRVGQTVQNAMTQKTGRDHWPHAFTVLLAGGGVKGGQVYGATTSSGGFVKDNPVTPADLSATILHHLGIDSDQEYWDEFQQVQRRLSEGTPIRTLG
jgi:Protein of unknown function (DUF1501)